MAVRSRSGRRAAAPGVSAAATVLLGLLWLASSAQAFFAPGPVAPSSSSLKSAPASAHGRRQASPFALPLLRARRPAAARLLRRAAAPDSETGPGAEEEEEAGPFAWPSERELFFEYVYERVYESGVGFAEGAAQAERKRRQRPFHLHIGAGRLGLGLVVPAVCRSGTPIGILQRPSGAWKPLMESDTLDVVINGQKCTKESMVVVHDLTELPLNFDDVQPDLFVLSEDPILLSNLVNYATSFSMSLGPFMKDVIPLLSTLPLREQKPGEGSIYPRPILYAAENDHKMVMEVAEALEGRVDVYKVMVDRICTSRDITPEGVSVNCEPYEGEMVVMLNAAPTYLPTPFQGQHVRLPSTEAQADYFYRRKFLLVNGSHTTLAFLTLCLRQPSPNAQAETYNEPGDHELINWNNCGDKLHREIWAWAVARLLILLFEFDTEVLLDAHGVQTEDELCDALLAYARETLGRFSSTTDTTSRVLQGGVANRWETRLRPVAKFLRPKREEGMRPIKLRLLEKAGLTLPYVKEVTQRLVLEAERFTGIKPLSHQPAFKEALQEAQHQFHLQEERQQQQQPQAEQQRRVGA